MSMVAALLHTRAEHGALPIFPVGEGYEIRSLDGGMLSNHRSKRELLSHLTGSRSVRWARYFRLDRPMPRFPPGGSVLDLFGPQSALTIAPRALARPRRQAALTVDPTAPVLGIDLARRGHEVRKLLFAGFGRRIARAGYDPEEVLQEVYRGILARNLGKCPFDARKSSFGHYVHLVISCILSNYHRREQRRREFEQVGLSSRSGEETDVALAAERRLPNDARWGDGSDALAMRGMVSHLDRLRARGVEVNDHEVAIMHHLRDGLGRQEIAERLGLPPARVAQLIVSLREHARGWSK